MARRFEVSAEWVHASGKGTGARIFDIVGTIDFPNLPSLITVYCDDLGWVVGEEHGRYVEEA